MPIINKLTENKLACVADPGCLSRIRMFLSWIPDPGSRVKKIPDPWSASKNLITVFFTRKFFSKLSEIWSGMFPNPDLDFFYPSRNQIQGSKRHRIPDPGYGSASMLALPAGLWICIHFLRIRIQSLMLEANTDPDPNPDPDPDPIRIQGFNEQKLKKNYSWKFF